MLNNGKVIAVSWRNKAVRVGDDWYELGDGVKLEDFRKGDELEIDVDEKVITSFKVTKKGWAGKSNYSYGNKDEQIKKLAIGHMVSRTLVGLNPSVSKVEELIDTLWAKYSAKVDAKTDA